jgi:ketosteroid isomerase-like protein
MDAATVANWVGRYVLAWESNDPAAIGGLFATNATYRQRPSDEPWQGREAIIARWLEIKDDPGSWTFRHDVLATAGDLAFVRGWTHYTNPPTDYDNLWVLRFDADGRCVDFTEWWMTPRES